LSCALLQARVCCTLECCVREALRLSQPRRCQMLVTDQDIRVLTSIVVTNDNINQCWNPNHMHTNSIKQWQGDPRTETHILNAHPWLLHNESPLRTYKHRRLFMSRAHACKIALFASNDVDDADIVTIALPFSCDVLACEKRQAE